MPKEDVSRNLVVIMLVFTILISIFSTWTIIGTINAKEISSITGYVQIDQNDTNNFSKEIINLGDSQNE